jgi:hypothetical protein
VRASWLILFVSLSGFAEPLPHALIDRPLTLPAGTLEIDALGSFSSLSVNESLASASGYAGVLGVEYGVTANTQLGLALAAPISPELGFGSVAGSALFTLDAGRALRVDLGYENLYSTGFDRSENPGLYFAGVGLPVRLRLGHSVAFVSGSDGAFHFAHFANLGANGQSQYQGAANAGYSSADLFSIAHAVSDVTTGTFIHVNLPAGFLIQIAEPFSITLRTGAHFAVQTAGGDASVHILIPIGIDAVFTVGAFFDVGASVSLPGEVTRVSLGDSSGGHLGYTDAVDATLWLRFRVF